MIHSDEIFYDIKVTDEYIRLSTCVRVCMNWCVYVSALFYVYIPECIYLFVYICMYSYTYSKLLYFLNLFLCGKFTTECQLRIRLDRFISTMTLMAALLSG